MTCIKMPLSGNISPACSNPLFTTFKTFSISFSSNHFETHCQDTVSYFVNHSSFEMSELPGKASIPALTNNGNTLDFNANLWVLLLIIFSRMVLKSLLLICLVH